MQHIRNWVGEKLVLMKNKRRRYRFIFSGGIMPWDKLAAYRLLANLRYSGTGIIWKVYIPDDLILQKYSCDSYSTVANRNDHRTISEFDFELYNTETHKPCTTRAEIERYYKYSICIFPSRREEFEKSIDYICDRMNIK